MSGFQSSLGPRCLGVLSVLGWRFVVDGSLLVVASIGGRGSVFVQYSVVLSSFAIMLMGRRDLVTLLCLRDC